MSRFFAHPPEEIGGTSKPTTDKDLLVELVEGSLDHLIFHKIRPPLGGRQLSASPRRTVLSEHCPTGP
jgi:hypothetical protein